ncbi:phage regulatory protein, Rha family [Citrifermentans bemidjiense Bem]|uniref:Phage regulatory protein, Rha family n=1 Tax=Citrifermentans bemidjiense (strain ATCC BAA-1014 / DSM 16622 / JCM 12645 / Bem) TaxID=404380 RepID=B5E823_CITBB|nr:Rha family transcriptional regulator [Citrifermentans bemidjiense]ACH39992.1 phage regulatory protein, Rha family [Citrifermentans bemidjiense Bem]
MTDALVSCQHRQAVTTSVVVAQVFGKRHKDVLRAITNLLADLEGEGVSRRSFAPRDYTDERGKTYQMYEMDRDGYSLLAMGFNGRKALRFKAQYIDAFNKMERALLHRENLSWQDQRTGNKIGRRAETDSLARFVDYATAQGSQSARLYFMNVTKMTHQALNLVRQAAPQSLRDTIDSMELSFLTTAEYLVQQTIEEGMAAGLPYKEIYRLAKDRVTTYAETLPTQRRISA